MKLDDAQQWYAMGVQKWGTIGEIALADLVIDHCYVIAVDRVLIRLHIAQKLYAMDVVKLVI